MNGNEFKLAAGAVVGLLIVVTGGIYLGNNQSGGVGSPPMAIAAPTATAAPTAPHRPRCPARRGTLAAEQPGRAWHVPHGVERPGGISRPGRRVDHGAVRLGVQQILRDPQELHRRGAGLRRLADQQPVQAALHGPHPLRANSRPGHRRAAQYPRQPAGDRSGPGHRRDGRWIQRQVRRADRRDGISTCPVSSGEDAGDGFWLWASPDGNSGTCRAPTRWTGSTRSTSTAPGSPSSPESRSARLRRTAQSSRRSSTPSPSKRRAARPHPSPRRRDRSLPASPDRLNRERRRPGRTGRRRPLIVPAASQSASARPVRGGSSWAKRRACGHRAPARLTGLLRDPPPDLQPQAAPHGFPGLTPTSIATCSEVGQEMAPPDGRRGSEAKVLDALAWYALPSTCAPPPPTRWMFAPGRPPSRP